MSEKHIMLVVLAEDQSERLARWSKVDPASGNPC